MENNNSSIDRLRQQWDAKVAMLYDKSLGKIIRSKLLLEVLALQEQIEELEWQQMTPEQQAALKFASRHMAKKFEIIPGIGNIKKSTAITKKDDPSKNLDPT